MNSSYYQSQVTKLEKEIADLQKKIADESKKEFDKQKQIDTINRSITKNTSISTLQSKQRQISNYQKNILDIKKKVSDLQKKVATKSTDLQKKKQELSKAEGHERKEQQKEQLDFQKKLQQQVNSQTEKLNILIQQNYTSPEEDTSSIINKEYDFFISHASEDKNELVRDLAEALKNENFRVWYDEFELVIGDSLRKKIDQGLTNSKYGIVIISPSFIKKNWTDYELNGMVAREMNGHKVILPIWHKVTKDEVLSYSPTLADKMALNTAIHSLNDIVEELSKLIRIE